MSLSRNSNREPTPSFWQRHKYKILAGTALFLGFVITGASLGLAGIIAFPAFFALGLSLTGSTAGNIAIGTGIAAAASSVAPVALEKLTHCSPCCSSSSILQSLGHDEEVPYSRYQNHNDDYDDFDSSSNSFLNEPETSSPVEQSSPTLDKDASGKRFPDSVIYVKNPIF